MMKYNKKRKEKKKTQRYWRERWGNIFSNLTQQSKTPTKKIYQLGLKGI